MSEAELTPDQIKLVNILEVFFSPVKEALQDYMFYTTLDVFRKLQNQWQSECYTTLDVLKVLDYLKYEKIDSATSDKIFWLMYIKK